MKSSRFVFMVIVIGLALAGIIFIQFYWIRNVRLLHEEQFDNKVRLALKGAVNQMYERTADSCARNLLCSDSCVRRVDIDGASIDHTVLDSLIRVEFGEIGISGDYVYGIINSDPPKVQYISDPQFKNELITQGHTASLSCIFKHDKLMLAVWLPDEKHMALHGLIGWLALCFVLLALLTTGFIISVHSFIKQKRISEMKSDFINNITHEFKTPIATISLASEMLHNTSVLASEEKALKYASIIYDENSRLKTQVEHVLQLALLDSGSYELKLSSFDLHRLLEHNAENFSLIMKERNGSIRMSLQAERHEIRADEMHIENIVNNLLDNAYKYSPGQPEITLSTFNRDNFVVIAVDDKGIGISRHDQKNIFRKLFRVSTGNVHNVKGTGLGLYYVKKLTEAHNGHISVHSEPGKGSRFEVALPLDAEFLLPKKNQTDENKNSAG